MSKAKGACDVCYNGKGGTSSCGECDRKFVMVPVEEVRMVVEALRSIAQADEGHNSASCAAEALAAWEGKS